MKVGSCEGGALPAIMSIIETHDYRELNLGSSVIKKYPRKKKEYGPQMMSKLPHTPQSAYVWA